MLYIEVRAMFILETGIVAQGFLKLAPPDRNNSITSVSIFYKLACVSSYDLSSVSSVLPMGLCRLGRHWHPCQKHPRYSKTFLVSAQYSPNFTFGTSVKWTSLPLPACVKLFLVRPMYTRNWWDSTYRLSPIWNPALAIIHTVSDLRNIVRNTLLQNGQYSESLPKEVYFNKF